MQGRPSRASRIRAALVATLVATTGLTALAPPAGAVPAFAFTRLAGADRYATAGAIAFSDFPLGTDTVIMATGENFPDALAGNFLAGVRNAPILLTSKFTPIPPATLTALQNVKARNVVLLGLTDAITQAVQDTLAATTSTAAGGGNLVVTRLGGINRYDTMKAIVLNAGAAAVGSADGRKTALLASGEAFPDALAVGPASYALKFPTILTTPNSLATAASDSLTALGIQQVIIPGGTVAISTATELAVQALGIPTLTRFSGANRSETSRIAADFAVNNLAFRANHMNIATGDNTKIGVDALAGGPHGGREPAVNLITNSSVDVGKTVEFAGARSPALLDGHVFGGTGAIPDDVLNQVTAAARGEGAPLTAPTIVAISPSAGPSGGGTAFTVTGTGLASTSVIDFCGVSTTTFTATATTVIGTTPSRPNGACFVNVSAAGGSAGVTFTYTGGPTITSIAPSVGPVAGGTTFTISGTNLAATTSVNFCGAAATSVAAATTTVTGATPARPAGPCTVTLTTPGGTAVVNFNYGLPGTATSISPLSGPIAGGTGFTITGTNLAGTQSVTFCAVAATSVVAPNNTTVTGITPARPAGVCPVVVAAPGGNLTNLNFTYGSAPVISTITPSSGSTAGGTVVTITGANLAGTTSVTFCGVAGTGLSSTATTITVTTPSGTGACSVVVTTPDGTAMITFTYGAAPTTASISPTSGPSAGGTSFTITGTNLTTTSGVTFCGTPATTIAATATTVTGTTPAKAAGSCAVAVTTASGTATNLSFTYTDVPAITAISPTSGPSGGGTAYTITGTSLAGATRVDFCGTNDTGFTAPTSGTTITGTTPGRGLLGFGSCVVTVTTPGGTAAVNFNYNLF